MKFPDQRKTKFLPLFFSGVILLLSACSAGGQEPPPDPGVTTLIYAQLSVNGVNQKALYEFNREHKGEVQIEVRDYTKLSEGGKQGVDLLMTEITAGRGPDIIELGTSGETSQLSYRRLAEQGYLEDLWPYIEEDPGLGRGENGLLKGVLEAPLQAAKINGGLYAIFEKVQLHTLVGAKSVVGDHPAWTPEELLNIFAAMPDGSVILEDYHNWKDPSVKQRFFTSLLYGFSDLFIDWEEGKCFFDGERFRSLLELTSCLPDQHDLERVCANQFEAQSEHFNRLRDGVVMLEDTGFGNMVEWRTRYDWFFGGSSYVGYPVDDGSSGSYFEPVGIKLAMSSACRDKEAAWLYMRQMYNLPVNYEIRGFHVGKTWYRTELRAAMTDLCYTRIGTEIIQFLPLTRKEHARIQELCDSTARSSLLVDQELVDLVMEAAGPYFAGDKTLDETVRLIQSRAELYVNENR